MDDSLTDDEYNALTELSSAKKHERPSACVARNTKRLSGLKYIAYEKDGGLGLTLKGKQTLFIKRCIDGLRAVAHDGAAPLGADVATFLTKKGHIEARTDTPGFDITQRGRESLADIDAH